MLRIPTLSLNNLAQMDADCERTLALTQEEIMHLRIMQQHTYHDFITYAQYTMQYPSQQQRISSMFLQDAQEAFNPDMDC